jgi:AraC-like DNA-binding protein
MKPWFETILVPPGQSWRLFDRQLAEFPFNWHYHPEFELTLTLHSEGLRFIGSDVAPYGHGDLVLVGPNLPHAWQSHRAAEAGVPHRALVCWFGAAWIEALLATSAELAGVRTLLQEARRGVAFGPQARRELAPLLLGLTEATPAQRWLGLLDALLRLSTDPQRRILSSAAMALDAQPAGDDRLGRVLDWLHEHYMAPLSLAQLAGLAHLSESQLQRRFRRSAGLSIGAYVTRLRIGHACALLAGSRAAVAEIGRRVGYAEAGYFARQFHAVQGCSPSAYRRLHRPVPGRPQPAGLAAAV